MLGSKWGPIVAASFVAACTGGGVETNPLFSGSSDAGGAASGDDGSSDGGDDGAHGESGSVAATNCPNDVAHSLAALAAAIGGKMKSCSSPADCASGQCCYMGMSSSVCIKQ
jgi:hypothetical protein